MTTGRTSALLDQADAARFDDDGGAPTRLQVAPAGMRPEPAAGGALRLSLAPAHGRGSFDGAWWPRTWHLASELPALVAALSATGETPSRMSVNGDIWTDIPHLLPRPARPPLRISWFRALDPHTVTLSSGNRRRVFLLVIPPDAAPEGGEEVLQMAATGRLSGPSGQILRHAGATPPPE
ncbi:hypothetical protein I6A84_20015 [Frankia sp. CNm7]|uniref:Uncharacterized protein n=1 Tax=Frankia nepalensis TaxID=1836974 RepID=A0A937RH88_9ACTN|nr:DUF5994 family protein [Frankia nepalensis]MBL7495618.1 hypothetical protein [Frankia nepalensis]MBL7508864.1 hypothetical protein [Frankia nepalensis]MBL7520312.1 hypothetical protein [Frankia nepalensis]MBL7630087.1 hypothetical protein [Frankia nepalensis]